MVKFQIIFFFYCSNGYKFSAYQTTPFFIYKNQEGSMPNHIKEPMKGTGPMFFYKFCYLNKKLIYKAKYFSEKNRFDLVTLDKGACSILL